MFKASNHLHVASGVTLMRGPLEPRRKHDCARCRCCIVHDDEPCSQQPSLACMSPIYWKPQSPSGTALVETEVQPPEALKSDHSLKCGIALCVSTASAST